MTTDELLASARVVAAKQMATNQTEENRLVLAYLAGVTAGGALVNAGVVANLTIAQAKQ